MENGEQPAYPCRIDRGNGVEPYSGLSKREIFAMAAMQGALAGRNDKSIFTNMDNETMRKITIQSVGFADSLLKALSKKQS